MPVLKSYKFISNAAFTLLLLLVFQWCSAEIYYVSPSGNDNTGNGTIAKPWRTILKATTNVSKPGDIIHVKEGVYTEKAGCFLEVGVSIEGEGFSTIIKCSETKTWTAILTARSPEGTNGNQHISNLKFDGQNLSSFWAIWITGRSNVAINNCLIINFKDRGIIFDGRNDNQENPPAIYATGNSFHDNILANCAAYNTAEGEYGRGCLNIGGQEGMLIYNNTISQDGRPDGYNGYPIKYSNDGYLKGLKIFHNIIIKKPFTGNFGGENGWDFAIELWNVEGGMEIYDNIIQGSTDIVNSQKGMYPFGVWFHDNIVLQKKLSRYYESGIILENSNSGSIIEHNIFSNISGCILFYAQKNSVLSDISIQGNILLNIGRIEGMGNSSKGILLDCGKAREEDSGYFVGNNITVSKNILLPAENHEPFYGIEINGPGKMTKLVIRENTFKKFLTSFLMVIPANVVDTIQISGNFLSGNGSSNKPLFINGIPSNFTYDNNIVGNAKSQGAGGYDIMQQIVRPLYIEMKETNRIILGALFFMFIAGGLAIYFKFFSFIFGLASLLSIFVFSIEKQWYGNALLCVIFMAICVFGGFTRYISFRKGKTVKHLPVIPGWNFIPALFVLPFVIIYFSMVYVKPFFPPDAMPFADSFVYASSLTGLLLYQKKAVACWYFWIVACSAATVSFYLKGYLVISFFCLALLLLALLGWFEWKRTAALEIRS